MREVRLLCALVCLVLPSFSWGFKEGAFYGGFGYYSENFMNRTSQSDDGSEGFLGEANYPLSLKYDFSISMDWYFAPQLSYTLLPRESAGGTAKVTMTHLQFQFGQNFGFGVDSFWEWNAGAGYMIHTIKGAGGTTQMNNGTSTAVFAVPGRESSVQKVTSCLGGAYTFGRSRMGLDLIIENLLSGDKRTQSFMLSYAYQLNGSQF